MPCSSSIKKWKKRKKEKQKTPNKPQPPNKSQPEKGSHGLSQYKKNLPGILRSKNTGNAIAPSCIPGELPYQSTAFNLMC